MLRRLATLESGQFERTSRSPTLGSASSKWPPPTRDFRSQDDPLRLQQLRLMQVFHFPLLAALVICQHGYRRRRRRLERREGAPWPYLQSAVRSAPLDKPKAPQQGFQLRLDSRRP